MNKQPPLLLILLVLYIFSPDIIGWSTNAEGSWYRPFIIWLVVIAAAFGLQQWGKSHDL